MNWYKIAQESTNWAESHMVQSIGKEPGDIGLQGIIKTDLGGGIPSNLRDPYGFAPKYGIEVEKCGDEPNSGNCCRKGFSNNGDLKWFNYSVDISGNKYRAYECQICHHKNRPFNVDISKDKKEKRRFKKKRNFRRSSHITQRRFAATPAVPMPGAYNNSANAPFSRLDLSEDARVIPWGKVKDSFDSEWDSNKQKNNKKEKVVKIKDKDGNIKFVSIKEHDTRGNGTGQANTYRQRGRLKKQHRYNPSKGSKQESKGAWPHNRNVGREGWYGQPDPGDNSNADGRHRVMTWDDYTQDRGRGASWGLSIPH